VPFRASGAIGNTMRAFGDFIHRIDHLAHRLIDLAAFVHLASNRLAVGGGGIVYPYRLLAHIRRRRPYRANKLSNLVSHVIEFTGQLTQLITVGQLYMGRHITSRHTSCGTTESVDSNPDGHEESNV